MAQFEFKYQYTMGYGQNTFGCDSLKLKSFNEHNARNEISITILLTTVSKYWTGNATQTDDDVMSFLIGLCDLSSIRS